MPTLKPLNKPKPPFEAPTPQTSPTLAAADVALATGASVGLIALDIVTGGIVSALSSIPDFTTDDHKPVDIAPLLATIRDTSAPVDDGEGNVQCTECTHLVPYATMSLNEDGYFCAPCAAKLTAKFAGGDDSTTI